jgi:valyl-tRNA synthetase
VIGLERDWSRTAYTFSPELSRAVREVFVRLYDDGLIYRGHRVIHWCPRCLTSLSDEEAEFAGRRTGSLFTCAIRSRTIRSGKFIDRRDHAPRDAAGRRGVAVHPDDERYRAFVGTNLRMPVNGLPIPVIADEYVDASSAPAR